MRILELTRSYLSERQTPTIRVIHLLVLLLVISQILVSNFMGFDDNGEISRKGIEYYGTWVHIITGLFIVPIAFVFVIVELRSHGFGYFFPYLSGDMTQLKADIGQLMQFKLPEPEEKGLASVVEGLGLGAMLLVLLTGMGWFISWRYHAPWAEGVKEVHEFLTGLVEAYVIGHGCMGLLHIYMSGKDSTAQ